MYRHLRNAGEHWIAVKAELGEHGINISQWASENLPVSRQWMDRHAELFKRWAEFLDAKRWADGLPHSADRRPSLQSAFDIMDTKKRYDIRSSARGSAHDAVAKRNVSAPAIVAANDDQQRISATSKTDQGKGSDNTWGPFALNPTSTLLQGDCIEMMRCHVADNSTDVVIADVPYFLRQPDQPCTSDLIEMSSPWSRFAERWDQYDDIAAYEKFCVEWIDEAMRVLDPAGSLFVFGTHHNIGLINRILRIKEIEILGHIVWLKRNAVPHLAGRRLGSSHETVLWAVKSRSYRFRYRECKAAVYPGDGLKKAGLQMRDVWDIPTGSRDATGHPSPKPVALYERLLDVAGKPGGLLLDPFAGGGTGAEAAMRWGMRSVNIERDDRYVEMIKRRLQVAPKTKRRTTRTGLGG
jgi:site-specific DNA-methyltransferase (adenine-specific)